MLMLLVASAARADVDGRVSLTGVLLTERQDAQGMAPPDASPATLGWGDLRAVVQGRRLGGGLEFKGDLRLRATSDFSRADAISGNVPITARGYSGGREYDLREAWIGRRGESIDFAAGRLIVRESDALRVDGARLGWRFSPAWQAAIFGGLYPNPYARSLPDSYESTSALAGAVGASASYAYGRIWGSASATGILLGGNDDGGPIDPAMPAGRTQTEDARVYVTWTNFLRAASWLDLFHDLVVDVAGPAGAQLTRADVLAAIHVGRLAIDLGYDHLSSLAVEMYLVRLLADRARWLPGTVESSLIVQRTARDEGRLRVEVRAVGRLRVFAEGRLRRRALVEPEADPAWKDAEPLGAWEAGGGVRSAGDLAGFRLGAAFTEIADFRARTHLFVLDAGRDFAGDRVALDANFIWEGIEDGGVGAPPCNLLPGAMMPMAMMVGPPSAGCFGQAKGDVFQVGVTLLGRPSPRWTLLGDYRLVYSSPADAPSLLTHVALARVEVRW